ncbi:hypothetical protein J2851_001311 [Azospirillum rugosum]|uniref:Uncharacterized protein n=1 Tax=Azospirillum rugosum TaxID=416170 RepID=A0ABS4SI04_9PROT|nr:hypothetical protein [Azospirillum rugosum]MDQ0524626.1 hypothetical protein [Azospirillum rugosum]
MPQQRRANDSRAEKRKGKRKAKLRRKRAARTG